MSNLGYPRVGAGGALRAYLSTNQDATRESVYSLTGDPFEWCAQYRHDDQEATK
jgi:hypothetical protein